MTRALKLWLPLAAVALLVAQDGDAVFRVDVNLVTLPVQVSTLDGSAAPVLTREDFVLLDNGEPREIESLWVEKDLPLTIGLVIDVSDSQAEWLAAQRATVAGFLRRLLRPKDRAFLVSVAADVRLVRPATAALDDLLAGLSEIEKQGEAAGVPYGEQCAKTVMRPPRAGEPPIVIAACGGTALWNAVWYAARLGMSGAVGRRALLVLSDGIDTGSTHALPEAAAELLRAEAVVYAIQYPRQSRRAALGLQRLAEQTGGLRFQPPAEGGSYEPVFARLEADLRNQYVLGFRPPAEPGFHRLELTARAVAVSLRTRSGYFVSPTAPARGTPLPLR